MGEIEGLLQAERRALIDLLETLPAEQWDAPSLCAGWAVQDVAAHVAFMPVMSPVQAARELARHRWRLNTMIAETARGWAHRGPSALLEQLRIDMRSGATPLGTSPLIGLADAVIHQLDIRRPLDRPRAIPEPAFVAVADLQAKLRWPSTIVVGGSARRRLQGVCLIAEDAEWAFGSGEEVRGSRDAILLTLTGRPVREGELRGHGVARLRASRAQR